MEQRLDRIKRIRTGDPSQICFEIPDYKREQFWQAIRHIESKGETWYNLEIKQYYKKRSTGWKSQNHHLRGHENQISEYTGYEISQIHQVIKRNTASWPMEDIFKDSDYELLVFESEEKITSRVCADAIETAHRIADYLNLILKEE